MGVFLATGTSVLHDLGLLLEMQNAGRVQLITLPERFMEVDSQALPGRGKWSSCWGHAIHFHVNG